VVPAQNKMHLPVCDCHSKGELKTWLLLFTGASPSMRKFARISIARCCHTMRDVV
jgi:hypothetical protein